jgi:aromatic-L-amino-acid decarboxylase
MVTLDWLGKLLNLPDEFLFSASNGVGGGVIQGTASEATLIALLAAKTRMLKRLNAEKPEENAEHLLTKFVAYTSANAHSSVERAGLLAGQ